MKRSSPIFGLPPAHSTHALEPLKFRGRVMSFMLPIGGLLTGRAADRFGPRPVLSAAAIAATAAAFLYYTRSMDANECSV